MGLGLNLAAHFLIGSELNFQRNLTRCLLKSELLSLEFLVDFAEHGNLVAAVFLTDVKSLIGI